MNLLLVACLLLLPAVGMGLARRYALARRLGPVVFSYGFGLLLGQLPFADPVISSEVRDLAIPLAIPLLLFGLDVRGWLSEARATVLSFGLCLLALVLSCTLAWALFAAHLPEAASIAGMLSALFSGGTPNMAVVHSALELPPALFLQVNAIDFLSGAVYFLFLISLAGPLFGRFLPVAPAPAASRPAQAGSAPFADRAGTALAIAGSLLIVALTAGLVSTLLGELAVAPIMLGITSLAIAASFWPRLRRVQSSYPLGYYLVNVFCCAIGSQLDVSQLSGALGLIAAMHLGVMSATIGLHLLFARLARIDRDTVIITQTAALYGPPFVPPVAGALGNPLLLISGLTTGLVGYALGNYLGIGLALLLGRL